MGILGLGQPGRVDAQDVGAEQGEGAGGDGAGDDPGEVEDPDPGGGPVHRGRTERTCGGIGGIGGGALCLTADDVDLPLLHQGVHGRTHRRDGHRERPCRVRALLDLLGRQHAERLGELLGPGVRGEAEGGEQPGAVVRVVGVGAHPAVGGAPEAGVRGEVDGRTAVDRQVPLADEGGGDRALVHPDGGDGATGAQGGQLGGGARADGHGGPGEAPHRQAGGQEVARAVEAHLLQQVGRPAEGRPDIGGGAVGGFTPGRYTPRGFAPGGFTPGAHGTDGSFGQRTIGHARHCAPLLRRSP